MKIYNVVVVICRSPFPSVNFVLFLDDIINSG